MLSAPYRRPTRSVAGRERYLCLNTFFALLGGCGLASTTSAFCRARSQATVSHPAGRFMFLAVLAVRAAVFFRRTLCQAVLIFVALDGGILPTSSSMFLQGLILSGLAGRLRLSLAKPSRTCQAMLLVLKKKKYLAFCGDAGALPGVAAKEGGTGGANAHPAQVRAAEARKPDITGGWIREE